ncbi:MAG TPA: redoxin domain-containing protein [Prolixibacteraceae bacterium]|nr:redoxin domain-containing protein [Prolixibacteraceae bacterium]HPS11659.1 redoxin domain-containing protein [Prolixibacteraceae bacterium]
MRTIYYLLLAAFLVGGYSVYAQENKINLPMIDQPVSNFTLTDQNGKQVSLSDYKGKNVMLIFSRGMVKEDYWCQICHYQYADIADIEKKESVREKYNLEVLFILPYSADTIKNWIAMFPTQMEVIKNWKYPKDTVNVSEGTMNWAKTTRKLLPKDFSFDPNHIETPFPILADANRLVSNGFKLYKNEPKAPQNTPAIYMIDKEGKLRFKYICQDTTDRPSFHYLFQLIEKMVL